MEIDLEFFEVSSGNLRIGNHLGWMQFRVAPESTNICSTVYQIVPCKCIERGSESPTSTCRDTEQASIPSGVSSIGIRSVESSSLESDCGVFWSSNKGADDLHT